MLLTLFTLSLQFTDMNIKNLHVLRYWSKYYTANKTVAIKQNVGLFTSYDIYLCDEILKKYLPNFSNAKKKTHTMCEIGSGEGKLLVKFARMFHCIPYGIEYAKDVAVKSKKLGVHTIIGNAFSSSLTKRYHNFFDIVFSYGFIEHILPPTKAVQLHVDLVKSGGYFVIQIPRFVGFNWWRIKFFRPDLIAGHNMTIMESEILEKLCSNPKIQKIYCGNYGTYKLRIPIGVYTPKYYLLNVICLVEYILNPILRLLFGAKGFETKFFSPAVMFIGKKLR